MADRFDKSYARRPAAESAPRRADTADLPEDDPLVELARIVSGNESFDEILGSRYRPAEPSRAAAPASRAAPRDTSFDLEAELLSDLQSSFDPAARPTPSVRAPEPRMQEPRVQEPRMQEPRMQEPRVAQPRAPEPARPAPPRAAAPAQRADTFDHLAMRPGAPVAPPRAAAPQAASPEPYVAMPDFGRGRVAEPPRRQAAPPPVAARDDDDYGDDYVDDDDLRADYEDSDDGYLDEPDFEPEAPRRSRKALITVGVVLAVVVVGGIAAYALKGRTSVSGGAPQVIAADESPTKVAPEVKPVTDPNAQQNKLIYDRADPDQGSPDQLQIPDDGTADAAAQSNESQASREISRIILPGGPGDQSTTPAVPGATDAPATDAGDDSGPRKVRTVVVKPDGTIVSSEAAPRGAAQAADTNAPAAAPAASAPTVVAAAPATDAPPAAAAPEDGGQASLDTLTAPAKDTSQLAPPAAEAAPAEVAAAPAPAAVKPAAPAPSSGGFVVQVSSQRTEAAALAAYKNLQRKFPSVLGDRAPDVAKADLGAKGVYYRARVGPMATRDEAVTFCEQLRAAGGDCIVQKN